MRIEKKPLRQRRESSHNMLPPLKSHGSASGNPSDTSGKLVASGSSDVEHFPDASLRNSNRN